MTDARPTTDLAAVLSSASAIGGQPADPLWLPPLPRSLTLETEDRTDFACRVGLIDRPSVPERDDLTVDLRRSHVSIVGGPGAGKSSLAMAICMAMAWQKPPDALQFVVFDMSRGVTSRLGQLRHVVGTFGTGDEDTAMSALAELATRRRSSSADQAASVIIIDDWALAVDAIADLPELLRPIVHGGPGRGVHLVVTSTTTREVHRDVRESLVQRVELRLTDPYDSSIGYLSAKRVPSDVPGRGLTSEGELFQAALPFSARDREQQAGARTDSESSELIEFDEEFDRQLALTNARWRDRRAPVRYETLPERLDATDLSEASSSTLERGFAIGIAAPDLRPYYLDLWGPAAHAIVVGGSRSGKTAVLQRVATLADDLPNDALVAFTVDVLDGLTRVSPAGEKSALGVPLAVQTAQGGEDLAVALAAELHRRSEKGGGTHKPEIVLLVDDYQLLQDASPKLAGLAVFLPWGSKLRFHVLVAHNGDRLPVSFDPLLLEMRRSRHTTLVLDGGSSAVRDFTPTSHRAGKVTGRAVATTTGSAGLSIQLVAPPQS